MIAKLIVVGWTLFIAYGFFSGLVEVQAGNPSDAVLGLAIVFSATVHLFLWLLVALPTYMLSRMFARKQGTSHA